MLYVIVSWVVIIASFLSMLLVDRKVFKIVFFATLVLGIFSFEHAFSKYDKAYEIDVAIEQGKLDNEAYAAIKAKLKSEGK